MLLELSSHRPPLPARCAKVLHAVALCAGTEIKQVDTEVWAVSAQRVNRVAPEHEPSGIRQ